MQVQGAQATEAGQLVVGELLQLVVLPSGVKTFTPVPVPCSSACHLEVWPRAEEHLLSILGPWVHP